MNAPRVQVGLEIYNNCHMDVTPLYGHDELRFSMSGPCQDDVSIAFERPVLERFVKLAREALKLQLPEDTSIDPPTLVSAGTD